MAKKEKTCEGCKIQYICRLETRLDELYRKTSFKLAFQTTAIAIDTYRKIKKVIAENCSYYTERTEQRSNNHEPTNRNSMGRDSPDKPPVGP